MVEPTPEGDALRTAAEDLTRRFPSIDPVIITRLKVLARHHDVRAAVERRKAQEREAARLAAMDTRNRWLRRRRGNAGPGIPGMAHISPASRKTELDRSEGLCGTKLIGDLEWGPTVNHKQAPAEWHWCRRCVSVWEKPGSSPGLTAA